MTHEKLQDLMRTSPFPMTSIKDKIEGYSVGEYLDFGDISIHPRTLHVAWVVRPKAKTREELVTNRERRQQKAIEIAAWLTKQNVNSIIRDREVFVNIKRKGKEQ